MSEPKPIEWQVAGSGYRGHVARFVLFDIQYGLTRQPGKMYVLSTRLPLASTALGQHYATPEDAMVAARKLWHQWIGKVTA